MSDSTPLFEWNIKSYSSEEVLLEALTNRFFSLLSRRRNHAGPFHVIFGGGSTPVKLHNRLLLDIRRRLVPWENLNIWVSDERMVPFEHPASNAGMIWRTLCELAGMKRSQLHSPDFNQTAEYAAVNYGNRFAAMISGNEPILALLGVGADGHTASIFPKGLWAQIAPETHAVSVGRGPDGHERISLMPRSLITAQHIMLLANTSEKRAAIEMAVDGENNPARYPLQIFRAAVNKVMVYGLYL